MKKANFIAQEDLLYQQESLISQKEKSDADCKELEEDLDKKDQTSLTEIYNQESGNESTNLKEYITIKSQLSESKSETNEYIIDPKVITNIKLTKQTLPKKPKKTSPPKKRVQTNKKKEDVTLEEKANEEMNKALKIYRIVNDNQFGNILNESIEKNIDGKYREKKEIGKIIEEQPITPITTKYEDYNLMLEEDKKFEAIQSIYENQAMNLVGKRDYLEEYDFFADDDQNRETIYNFTEKNSIE